MTCDFENAVFTLDDSFLFENIHTCFVNTYSKPSEPDLQLDRSITLLIHLSLDRSLGREIPIVRSPERSIARSNAQSIAHSIDRRSRLLVPKVIPNKHPEPLRKPLQKPYPKTCLQTLLQNSFENSRSKSVCIPLESGITFGRPPPPLGPPTKLRKPELATVWTWVCALGFELEISNGWAPHLILREIE